MRLRRSQFTVHNGQSGVDRNAIVLALTYGAMGASGIVGQAIASLTKDGLHLTPAQTAMFMAVMGLPVYLSPLYGWLSDCVPVCGSRRESYLVISGVSGAIAWGVLGLFDRPDYVIALIFLSIATMAMNLSITVANGLMIEVGKRSG